MDCAWTAHGLRMHMDCSWTALEVHEVRVARSTAARATSGDADETTADLHSGAIESRHLSRHRRPLRHGVPVADLREGERDCSRLREGGRRSDGSRSAHPGLGRPRPAAERAGRRREGGCGQVRHGRAGGRRRFLVTEGGAPGEEGEGGGGGEETHPSRPVGSPTVGSACTNALRPSCTKCIPSTKCVLKNIGRVGWQTTALTSATRH